MRDWGMPLARNPAKAIRRPQISNARERRLQGDEEARLLAACDTGRIACMKALLSSLVTQGCAVASFLAFGGEI